MRITKSIALLGCLLYSNPGAARIPANDTLLARQLHPIGRTLLNTSKQLELVTSAAHFGVSFTGSTCTVYVKADNPDGYNYLQYELDGVYQKRIRVEGKPTAPIIINAPIGGKHQVWIYKATEAHTGALVFSKIVAGNIKALTVPLQPLIEFIGNSITCGAAADASEIPCGSGQYHDQHNAYKAYGPSVARMLYCNYIVSSVSGIGIYRTWNRESPNMPQVYDNLDFQVNSTRKWNHATYQPKIISIALGTNDLSHGDGSAREAFDSTRFISAYVQFIQHIKQYHPDAQIALLSSPMVKNAEGALLQRCLTAIKNQVDALYPSGKKVAVFFFTPLEPHGCTGHPDVADHQIMANELKPFFKRLLGS
ncbi:GDSL-like Lipase/Acylhydrolase family protein [Filimonas lacunae]|uniref:GDSL-like Lipase/Acylhydrolase family protein n=1 Tax=Filimonas lacunae TaxID=477680 RepID=A0A173MIL2_9BACT|nr:SGNH/GDSL hydrolase family protein [Filimonas lacunae]BAV07464.1 endoglucanase E precursor [Filimonas lacunae]SIT30278.1 GDSL-like Lipase/Acylhydrolase family protein [Filimonas lacunae]